MKKYLLNLMTILMVTIVSVGFVSCGGDDDDDEISIVGTWRCDWSDGDGYTILTFNSNGLGNLTKRGEGKTRNEMFKYAFDTKTMTLILMFWDDEDGDYTDYDEPAHISSLTSKSMVIDGYVYYKQ